MLFVRLSTGLKDCVRYKKILKNINIIRYNKLHDAMAFSLCSLFIAEINPHDRVHHGKVRLCAPNII